MTHSVRLYIDRTGFLEGMGRIFDFSGSLDMIRYQPSERVADSIAIFEDWSAVGDDLRVALDEAPKEPARSR